MKYRTRIYYSAEQRAEIWDRWQRGESMRPIGRVFDRQSSSVFSVISPTGGIRPPDRRRGRSALSLSEREEISRGLSTKQSLRVIARQLGRAPSTISREVRRVCCVDQLRSPRIVDIEPLPPKHPSHMIGVDVVRHLHPQLAVFIQWRQAHFAHVLSLAAVVVIVVTT